MKKKIQILIIFWMGNTEPSTKEEKTIKYNSMQKEYL